MSAPRRSARIAALHAAKAQPVKVEKGFASFAKWFQNSPMAEAVWNWGDAPEWLSRSLLYCVSGWETMTLTQQVLKMRKLFQHILFKEIWNYSEEVRSCLREKIDVIIKKEIPEQLDIMRLQNEPSAYDEDIHQLSTLKSELRMIERAMKW